METNFNFKSSVCTNKVQSERLLSLGLKKETADCRHFYDNRGDYAIFHHWACSPYKWHKDSLVDNENIPAWSLGRLIKDLMPQSIGRLELAVGGDYVGYYVNEFYGIDWKYSSETSDMFDNIISTIEWLIKEGYFNKEYLEE